jgi:hypothetical protein
MKILKATYGGEDCTKEVQAKVKNGKLVVRADNNIIGDPKVGQVKELLISFENGQSIQVKEGYVGTYPETKTDRLGIFYSNNNNTKIYTAISKSLDTIKIASEGKADIVTCMWQPMPGNPFLEVKSWYTSYSHLNQLLQIMQSLYVAINTYPFLSMM